jgi:DNA-binding MarR family transcriptional regulator
MSRPTIDIAERQPHIGGLLRLAWEHVRRSIYEGVRQAGYSDLQPAHVALFRYPEIEGLRPTQLAEQANLTKQSINGVLRHLERTGYVELRPDPKDARARLITFTDRGREFMDLCWRLAEQAELEFAAVVGEHSFWELRSGLERFVAATNGGPHGDLGTLDS